ncbi:MAG: GNAT family N-acetyltransferase [Gemmatimonadaceae bacterium]|nr:GNAT family N-acetyltransferase [Gemmatimonadaceae bacterium]
MTADVRIERAEVDDLGAVVELLRGVGLPVDDVAYHIEAFVLAREDGQVVGTSAIEVHGDAVLLRSVAVAPSHRGRGIADVLMAESEAMAVIEGARHLYLLTTTAADYFAVRGFEIVTREVAGAAIGEAMQFRSLCPASATCMRRAVAGGIG